MAAFCNTSVQKIQMHYIAWKYFAALLTQNTLSFMSFITFWLKFTDIWERFEAGEIIESAVLKYKTTVFLSIEIIRFSIPTPTIKALQYQN